MIWFCKFITDIYFLTDRMILYIPFVMIAILTVWLTYKRYKVHYSYIKIFFILWLGSIILFVGIDYFLIEGCMQCYYDSIITGSQNTLQDQYLQKLGDELVAHDLNIKALFAPFSFFVYSIFVTYGIMIIEYAINKIKKNHSS